MRKFYSFYVLAFYNEFRFVNTICTRTLRSQNECAELILPTLRLTHDMAMIQPSFTSSKWNMGEIFMFKVSYVICT